MLIAVIGAVVHNAVIIPWYIEDAAISMAYAENIADGFGAVPQPGADRLEGYSNPTWVAVMVGLRLLGLPLYDTLHWLQLGLCVATLGVVWQAGRALFGRDSYLPLVPPAFLAASSQFAIWGQAGLENGLWNFLFALGLWRVAIELEDDEPGSRFPWSAACWLGIALTRPEGILYAAVAGATHLAWHAAGGRGLLRTAQWLAIFFVPWTAYQALHYWYFAWPFPNTYYAKMAIKELGPLSWNKRSWNWSRNFFLELGQAFFLPVWLFGLLGHEGWRKVAVAVAFVALAIPIELSGSQRHLLPAVLTTVWLLFWAGLRWAEPRPPRGLLLGALAGGSVLFLASEAMRQQGMLPNQVPVSELVKMLPPYLLLAGLGPLTLLAAGGRRWAVRMFVWLACWCAIAFAVYSNGDWMKGFRWYAMATVPASFLFAWGAESLARFFEEIFADAPSPRWTPAVAAIVVAVTLAQVPLNVLGTVNVTKEFDASPKSVKPRVDFVLQTLRRISYDEPPVVLDVDMGAHLLWTDWKMIDIAGLVDLPFAHHKFERPFVREYVFEEQRPPVIHIHGGWSSTSRVPSHTEFRDGYVEIPGFPAGPKQFHVGNYLRRDLLVRPDATGLGEPVRFADGIELWAPRVRAEPATDRAMAVDLGLRDTTRALKRDQAASEVRVVMFASRDGVVAHAWDVAPGFELLPMREWKPEEVFVGPLVLPTAGLEPGTYDLGYVVLRADGTPLPVEGPVPEGVVVPGEGVPAVYASSEVRYPDALVVLTLEDRAARAQAEREAALADAVAGRCAEAEVRWRHARDHRAGEVDWAQDHADAVATAFASCWAEASAEGAPEARVRDLLRARRWRWDQPDVVARARVLADEREAVGLAARAEGDWALAYRALSDAADLDGTRSWARRYAEEARAERLDLHVGPGSVDASDELRRKQRKGFMIGPQGQLDLPRYKDPPAPPPPPADAPGGGPDGGP